MRQALGLIGLCCALAACGSAGKAEPPMPKAADTSRTVRANDAWCAERQAEVAPAELTAIRGQEARKRARFNEMLAQSDANSDMYELGRKSAEAMLAEEGLMLSPPLPVEVDELVRRLHALPADSAAREWGATLAGYREILIRMDRELKQPHPDKAAFEDEAKRLETYGKPEALTAQAAQAGVAACGPMVLNPDRARIYATLAFASISDSAGVDDIVGALRKQEPWLMVRALPDACALPAIGDPAAGEPISSFAVGIWKDADGTLSVTANDDLSNGGTLAHSASGETWTIFTLDSTDAGEARRVEPCPR